MERKVIKKPNRLITAKLNLTSREQDLLALLMFSVKSAYDNEYFNLAEKSKDKVDIEKIPLIYKFSIDEMAALFNCTREYLLKKNKNKFLLNEVSYDLFKQEISILNNDNSTFRHHRLVTDAVFCGKYLTLVISPFMRDEMVDFNSYGFGKCDLKIFFKLNSSYGKRIFELVSRYENNLDYEVSVGMLCGMLGISLESYSRPTSFLQTVLRKPIDAIINASDGEWEKTSEYGYTVIKNGRKLTDKTKIIFNIKKSVSKDTLLKVKTEYNLVLKGELLDMDRLTQLINDIDTLKNEALPKNLEFMKMWAACLNGSCNK